METLDMHIVKDSIEAHTPLLNSMLRSTEWDTIITNTDIDKCFDNIHDAVENK